MDSVLKPTAASDGDDNLPASASELLFMSAFDLLHEKVRRWIWKQGWTELRDIQERSIPILLDGKRDLIIVRGTASGKTEAAFLPIVSRLAWDDRTAGGGFQALYVSPLRALINDQFGRIERLCEEIELPVTKWHGDVSASVKERARKRPHGILLTTPESLEAILVRRGGEAGRLFGGASLHRGRRDARLHGRTPRPSTPVPAQPHRNRHRTPGCQGRLVGDAGGHAHLGRLPTAARPGFGRNPGIQTGGQELRLQLRGYLEPALKPGRGKRDDEKAPEDPALNAIVKHLFDTLRGQRSLIFAGSRNRVELVTANLAVCARRWGCLRSSSPITATCRESTARTRSGG